MKQNKVKSLDADKGWLYNFLAQFIWGTGGIVINMVSKSIPTTILVGLRHGIGAGMLGIMLLKNKQFNLKNVSLLHIIIFGLFAGALPDLLLVTSIRRCGPIIGVILARLEIPIGVLLAHVILKEKVTLKAYIASFIALIGGILVSFNPGISISFQSSFYIGILAGVGAGALWALTSIVGKSFLNKGTNPLELTFLRLLVGSISSFVLAFLFVKNPFTAIAHISKHDWVLLVYLGIFVSGIAYFMFYKSLELVDAYVAQILIGVTIITLLVLGVLTGQSISLQQWIGVAVITASIYLIRAKPIPLED